MSTLINLGNLSVFNHCILYFALIPEEFEIYVVTSLQKEPLLCGTYKSEEEMRQTHADFVRQVNEANEKQRQANEARDKHFQSENLAKD